MSTPQTAKQINAPQVGSFDIARPGEIHFPSPPFKPVVTGTKVVWGIPSEIKPLFFGLPLSGRVRFRFRAGKAGKAYVRERGGIRCFVIEDCGDHWAINPKLEQARNVRL
jgi:hypothetical protein